MASLDMADLLEEAYHVSDIIARSEPVQNYLQKKRLLEQDETAKQLIREFQQKKERFEEAKRFGHYHPNYHEARREALAIQRKMELHATIGAYLKAERELDELLFQVMKTIAHAISPSVKIGANDPRLERSAVVKSLCG